MMHSPTIILTFILCVMCIQATPSTKELTESAKLFSTSFFKKVVDNNKNKNLFTSSLNAQISLSMVAYGAAGRTAKQIRESLYLPPNDAIIRQNFQDLLLQLKKIDRIIIKYSNRMYVDKRYRLRNEYKQLTSQLFHTEPLAIDNSQPELSAKFINDCVFQSTNQMIRNIIQPSEITPNTRMVIINSIYFKGRWARSFEKQSTRNRMFQIDKNTHVQVPVMFSTGNYFSGELSDLKAEFVQLPFENNNFKMIVIVPYEVDGLKAVVENLESFNSTRLASSGSLQNLHVYLPKFRILSSIDLKIPSEQLGMTDMFNGIANFSGISIDPLVLDKIVQKAFIEVDEEGNEASNSGRKRTFSPSSSKLNLGVFVADRPFLFQIVNDRIGMTLFTGVVTNPDSN